MEAPALNLPRRLGRYDIVGRLALGGMAEILLARLTGPSGFERAVVVKRILPHLAQDPSFVDMFLDEGRLAARIHHPNVVQVQELEREGGELYLVMEYLEGESAAGLLRRARARRLSLSPVLAAHIVADAAAGLHAAHELADADGTPLGVVHRDISPQNLFISYAGSVKILDFGIAKAADRITQTEAGSLKGKFEYMSPEQALGAPLDRRSDVFSLGTVLYELLTSRRLFKRGTQLGTLRAVTDDPITPPSAVVSAVPKALSDVCMKALSRAVSGRHATALDLRRELLSALKALEGPAMPEEALASLMHELFDGRIREKRDMLARMRDGLTPRHVPAADVDVTVELPSVEVEIGSEIRAKPLGSTSATAVNETPMGSRPAWLVPGGVLVGLALVTALVLAAFRLGSGESPDAEPRITAPTTTVRTETDTVRVAVQSQPTGATIFVDGRPSGTTPASLALPRRSAPLTLRLELADHLPLTERVTPDVDQRLQLTLLAAQPATAEVGDDDDRRRARPPRDRTSPRTEDVAPAAVPMEADTDDDARERAFRRFN